MLDNVLVHNEDLETRKEQAIQLDIELDDEMSQEAIEEEIGLKLETGMKDIKNILN